MTNPGLRKMSGRDPRSTAGRWLALLMPVRNQFQKFLVDASVLGQFRVEGGGHRFALAHGYRIVSFCGDDLYAWAHAFDLGRADEDHFDWRVAESAFTNRAVDLATVGVAANADIQSAQARLLRIGDFFGQKDCARASAESGFDADEFLQLSYALLPVNSEEGARFAAGDHKAVDFVQLFGPAHQDDLGAEFF